MSEALVRIINFYQRFVSPYKGFRCAAGVYYGSDSCSQVVKNIIEESGAYHGRHQIRSQFRLCASASRALRAEDKKKPRRRRRDGDAACWLAEAACWSCTFWQ